MHLKNYFINSHLYDTCLRLAFSGTSVSHFRIFYRDILWYSSCYRVYRMSRHGCTDGKCLWSYPGIRMSRSSRDRLYDGTKVFQKYMNDAPHRPRSLYWQNCYDTYREWYTQDQSRRCRSSYRMQIRAYRRRYRDYCESRWDDITGQEISNSKCIPLNFSGIFWMK